MLTRIVATGLAVLAATGCDRMPSRLGDSSGTPFALATARSWRFEEPPADTLPAITRRVWHGPSVDPLGSPSPDGLTYAHRSGAAADIVLRDLESGELRSLIHDDSGFGWSPRFSRDGSRLAYTWMEREVRFQLRVVDAAGGAPHVLHAGGELLVAEDWSPDGSAVVAGRVRADGVNELWIIAVADGHVQAQQELERDAGSAPRGAANFSPDGRFVVYDKPAGDRRADRDLFVMAADGSGESRVLDHPANDFVLGWAPNGSVLFASDRTGTLGAWLLPMRDGRASGSPRLVKPDLWRARPIGFTRDGSYFYSVDAGTTEIYVGTLDAESRTVVGVPVRLDAASLGLRDLPEWSPDGRYLAYVVQTDGSGAAPSFYLAVRSLQTGEVREHRLPPRIRGVVGIRWMGDGRSLLLWTRGTEGEELLRVDVQAGGTDRPMIPPSGYAFGFEITPGADSVVYAALNRAQWRWQIMVRGIEGGAERELFGFPWAAPAPGAEMRGLFDPAVSRDGRLVAFRDGSPENARIMTMPVAGGEPRELPARVIAAATAGPPQVPSGITFTPDGRALLVASLSGNDDPATHVYRVDLDGGAPQPIGLAMEGLTGIRFHPDGRRIAFTAGLASRNEIWVLEGFLTTASDSGSRRW